MRKIFSGLGYAFIVSLVYVIVANIVYYFSHGSTMWKDWNYYGWVQYAYIAGLMLMGVSILEVVRAIIAKE